MKRLNQFAEIAEGFNVLANERAGNPTSIRLSVLVHSLVYALAIQPEKRIRAVYLDWYGAAQAPIHLADKPLSGAAFLSSGPRQTGDCFLADNHERSNV